MTFREHRAQARFLPTIDGMGLEYAVTPHEQERGLMGRESLPDDKGMLFLYPRPGTVSFWMKNTTIPLDIVFIDESGKVIGIDILEPESLVQVHSPDCCKYALEVNRGWCANRNLQVGDQLL